MNEKIVEMVNTKVINALENGVCPWNQSWSGGVNLPINYVSRKAYRGINLFLLPMGGEWLTFKQVTDCGGKVKKGEKSSFIIFWNFSKKKTKDENDETIEITIPVLKYYNVFHITQCEGIESKMNTVENNIPPIAKAETVISNYVSGLAGGFHTGDASAYYIPSNDSVHVPAITQFTEVTEYYATVFHELTHSTGHESRLNRNIHNHFGDESYGKEELVAEMGSCLIMAELGIQQPSTFDNSAAYLDGWIKAIKGEPSLIITASTQARKAAELIIGGDSSEE